MVEFSTQSTSTNTLSVDMGNRPFRGKNGRLVFRPSGHGALLKNLNTMEEDFLFIKNIDNVVPEYKLKTLIHWKKLLAGTLFSLQGEIFYMLNLLTTSIPTEKSLSKVEAFVKKVQPFGLEKKINELSLEKRKNRLMEILNRPIRVCGVVPATGEPGGGPFWGKGFNREIIVADSGKRSG